MCPLQPIYQRFPFTALFASFTSYLFRLQIHTPGFLPYLLPLTVKQMPITKDSIGQYWYTYIIYLYDYACSLLKGCYMNVATVGDNCVDVYEKEGRQYPGGNPVNVAVYLRRLGIDASYTGVVGTDEYGRNLIDALNDKGVDTSHVHTAEGSTAVTKVEIVNGNRVFGDYIEGVMEDFRLTDDDITFLCRHDLVVSGIWGHTAGDLGKIKANGTTIAFDYSDQPNDPIVDASITHVDYAFFGLESDDTAEVRAFMRDKQAKGPRVVVVTLGEHGSLAFDGRDFYKHGIIEVDIADTMGAGDSFIAGFIKGVLEGRDVPGCMDEGAGCSAITLRYNGAW